MRYTYGGKNYYIAIPPPYFPRGEKWFPVGKIYYIAIFPPIQVTGKNGSVTPDWCLLQMILSLFLK